MQPHPRLHPTHVSTVVESSIPMLASHLTILAPRAVQLLGRDGSILGLSLEVRAVWYSKTFRKSGM